MDSINHHCNYIPLTIQSRVMAQEYECEYVEKLSISENAIWSEFTEIEIDEHNEWFWKVLNGNLYLVQEFSTNGQGPFSII
jgi:hypothetical protein